MHVVYHKKYEEIYSSDPAAAPGRIECISDELEHVFQFTEPKAARESDLLLVHSQSHIESVKHQSVVYEVAVLAVGGALKASELDWGGLLKTEDYAAIGRVIKEYVDETCGGKVFAVLEGGYNHNILGRSVMALLEGLD